ncbi:MAG: YfhO family protein [Lachnospiraceae bacterium]|nr:YfhO family protein [Lachnospiraceae bacterium]
MKKQWKQVLISFILPVLVLLIIYMLWGQYPFGENTLLIWDMDEQYAPFFAHLHNILHGDASGLYTFSRALGGNMLSVAAYYLISPFNLVFYFFDAENIYVGILLVTLLKAGACGGAMYRFLNRKRQDISALIFSTAYALCAYMIAYQFNIFWIDAIVLLPFVCEGIERLVDEQKYLLYAFSIALSVITNFYTGYMICIFSVMYFLCYFFFISDKKYRFKTILIYSAASLLGGMLSMCVSLPTLDIMRDGKTGISFGILKNFQNMFKYGELFDAAFCATISDNQITQGRPLIYCGVFAIIMTIYWMVNTKEANRKKLAYLLLLFAMAVSFHHYNLNCVWHAFNRPTGSPYRYSFIYVFLFLYMAYKGYTELTDLKDNTKYDTRVTCGIGLALCLILLCRAGVFMENRRISILALNVLLVTIYTALVVLVKNKTARTLLILIFTCAELFTNAECLYTGSSQYASVSVAQYREYMNEMLPLVEKAKNSEAENGGIVRTAIDRSARRTANDAFLFSIYGMDSYTSVEKQNVIRIAGNFGYSNNILWGMHYNNGSTQAGESFLGVKYLISGINPGLGYHGLEDSDSFAVYENENVLPFAFFTNDSILEIVSFGDTFQYMNELYRSLDAGQDEDIFIELDKRLIQTGNCNETEDGGWEISDIAKGDETKESYLEYEYETDSEMTIYTRYDKAGVSKAEVYIEGEIVDLDSQRGDVKSIGRLNKGSRFTIRFYLPEDGILSPDKIYVYGERDDILETYAESVNSQPVKVIMNNEADIDILCTNEDADIKYLLCTLPYDKGWRAKVDGKTVEILNVQDFAVLPIEYGTHEIELKFIPRGLYPGMVMTFVSVLAVIFTFYGRKFSVRLNFLPKNGILNKIKNFFK